MELMQRVKGYSDSREEEEEEEAAEIITITREESSRLQQQDAASSNNFRKQLELMDMSLGRNKVEEEGNFQKGSGSGSGSGSGGVVGGCSTGTFPTHHASTNNNNIKEVEVEKEHMFDKVVTPSDVGKLNRLVIPKQHAEKYFPLDASSNEKGLLLNFEDRNGKLWRFRYSYWNSSQSYVMTKGWSRFVKEKKLETGDIVSFQRGLGDLYRHKLYIDWRRRPDHAPADHHHPSPTLISPLFLPNHYSIRWGTGRLYSLPSLPPATSTMPPPHHDHFHHHLNSNHMYTFHHQQHHHHPHHQQYYGGGNNGNANGSHHNNYTDQLNSGSGSVYYLRSTPSMSMQMGDQNLPGQQQERGNIAPMIIDSVPVAHHHHHRGATTTATSTAGKRLRLFGVNMECASSPAEDPICLSSSASAPHMTLPNSLPSSSLPPPLRVPHEDPLSSSARFGDQRGTTSLLFDLDPSFQYRQ